MTGALRWRQYLGSVGAVIVCTFVAGAMLPFFARLNLIMVYLVGVVFVGARFGRGPAALAAVLSVLCFDFFFVPPYLTFAVSDTEYLFTFVVMLLVGLIIGTMTTRMKEQALAAQEREQRANSLYQLSREFAGTSDADALARIAAGQIEELFAMPAVILIDDDSKDSADPARLIGSAAAIQLWYAATQDAASADDGAPAGEGQEPFVCLPLRTPRGSLGSLYVFPAADGPMLSAEQLHTLETFTNQTALAVERAQLAEQAEHVRVQMEVQQESERLRNLLLSSVSYNLRTPLAVITGAASSLVQGKHFVDGRGRELAEVIYEDARRLDRLVSNLLEMSRFEAGAVKVRKEWQLLDEVVGAALLRLNATIENHPVVIRLPDDLPAVPIDGVLIEEVLVNLIENAVKYTPAGTEIGVSAWVDGENVVVEVADGGPGLPRGEEERVFAKFYRARPGAASGMGLGLAICRAAVEAHKGTITAANRATGGAAFRFNLPLGEDQPQLSQPQLSQPEPQYHEA